VVETMIIHDVRAVKRNIHFKRDISIQEESRASEECCWNCFNSQMNYDDLLWCNRERDEVDYRDQCISWNKEKIQRYRIDNF
jgi:hypothetical protein